MEFSNPAKKYRHAEHLVYSCQYHVIFCPKYRRPVLWSENDTRDERLKELFNHIADKYEFNILDMEIMPDHIHLLIECNPEFGIMNCVRKLKRGTSRIMRQEYPDLVTRLPNLWTRSAFISTVGDVSLNTVKQYIRNQKGV